MRTVRKLLDTGKTVCYTDTFAGLNKNLRIRTGITGGKKSTAAEWSEEQNLTAEHYPVFATRRERRAAREDALDRPAGMIAKDALAVIDGQNVIYNGQTIEMGLSTAEADCPKQLVSMGAYLMIWPDKKYLNTKDFSDRGSVDRTVTVIGQAAATICTLDGTAYALTEASKSPTAPEDPTDGQRWLDTSVPNVPVLKEWSATSAMWVQVPTVYVKISATGIANGFAQYDGVEISGIGYGLDGNAVLWGAFHDDNVPANDYIVIVGMVPNGEITVTATEENPITVSRTAPDMDYITEAGNRLWGCKYGMVNGEAVNEIYASKLGDFKNWRCYMGLSTDSYAASRGSDGAFTGATTHLGHPLFFKEGCIEKVYPSSSGAHQIVTIEARGVQAGCWRSLAIVGQTLFYKARDGVCAYTGSLPVLISEALGTDAYGDARGGAAGELYYLSMQREDGTWHLLTYDTAKGLWHREDDTKALCFAEKDGEMHFIDENSKRLWGVRGAESGELEWYAVSGAIGYEQPWHKYLSRFVIRAETEGEIRLELRYDDGPWMHRGTYFGSGLRSIVLPVPPRRCDHVQYRISGTEACRIYSITTFAASGSDAEKR